MANKLNTLDKTQLLKVAAEFGSDQCTSEMTKPQIVKELETDGVTYDMWLDLIKQDPDEDDPVEMALLDDAPLDKEYGEENDEDERTSLVRMTRKNFSYQIRGYQFSQTNPYALVTEDDADFLVETGGFRMASPKELKEFYAKK